MAGIFFFLQEWQLNSSCLFLEWPVSRSLSDEFEELPVDNFADILRQFYAEVRNRKGETYGKSALINLRASIQRHISSPPYNRTMNIMKDRDFIPANHVLQGVLKTNRLQGRDKTQHKKPLEAEDMSRIDEVLDLSSPTWLQMRVFVDIMMHFGRLGREGLRDLKKDSFSVLRDATGREYVYIAYNEVEKTRSGLDMNVDEHNKKMYAEPQSEKYPVKLFNLYLSKLNPQYSAFFQRPNPHSERSGRWYDNMAIGKHSLGQMMDKISEKANLSTKYTNHCLRATTITTLKHVGIAPDDICSVTGHWSTHSIKYYCNEPSTADKQKFSKKIHEFMKPATNSDPAAKSSSPESRPPRLGSPRSITRAPSPKPSTSSYVEPPEDLTMDIQENNGWMPGCNSNSQIVSKVQSMSSAMFAGAVFNRPTTFNFYYKETWNNCCNV